MDRFTRTARTSLVAIALHLLILSEAGSILQPHSHPPLVSARKNSRDPVPHSCLALDCSQHAPLPQITSAAAARPISYMSRLAPIPFAVVASLVFCASLVAQSPRTSAKPSAQVSSLPALQPTTPEPPPPPLTPSQRPPNHAQVTYAGGMLSVSADNSSLNQILRQIGSSTGIKITGGVADERVFGQYGPATPAQVLASLLEGTGSNMVIAQRDTDQPAELILTPRQGGPTPPNPNAAAFDDRPEPRPAPPAAEVEQPASVPVTPPPQLFPPPPRRPAQQPPPTPPSPILPTESKRRSRSMSNCSACVSNSSNPSLNRDFFSNFFFNEKGQPSGMPIEKLKRKLEN